MACPQGATFVKKEREMSGKISTMPGLSSSVHNLCISLWIERPRPSRSAHHHPFTPRKFAARNVLPYHEAESGQPKLDLQDQRRGPPIPAEASLQIGVASTVASSSKIYHFNRNPTDYYVYVSLLSRIRIFLFRRERRNVWSTWRDSMWYVSDGQPKNHDLPGSTSQADRSG